MQSVSANVLGAEAVSEFTAKSSFKERLPSFSPKALFEVQMRLLPLPLVIGGRLANVNFYCPFADSFWLCHPAETFGPKPRCANLLCATLENQ